MWTLSELDGQRNTGDIRTLRKMLRNFFWQFVCFLFSSVPYKDWCVIVEVMLPVSHEQGQAQNDHCPICMSVNCPLENNDLRSAPSTLSLFTGHLDFGRVILVSLKAYWSILFYPTSPCNWWRDKPILHVDYVGILQVVWRVDCLKCWDRRSLSLPTTVLWSRTDTNLDGYGTLMSDHWDGQRKTRIYSVWEGTFAHFQRGRMVLECSELCSVVLSEWKL